MDPGAVEKSRFTFECFLRSCHPFGGQHGAKDGVPRGVGQRTPLPMGNLTSPNLLEADMRRDRQADRISHLLFCVAEQLSRQYRSRDDAVGRLIPTMPALFRSGVDESTKHLVTQNRPEDYVFAAAVSCVHDGQHRGEEVAWMAGR